MMTPMSDAQLAGRTLGDGRYDVLALLGAGGMGAVYRVRDRELDELVALKVLRSELGGHVLERFRHEVKLARRVTHPNVARIYELGHSDGITYCTMELVDGESLLARLQRGPVPIDETIAIVRAVCDGLGAAHAAGVIHRDIKPDNILLARDGRTVVADFGVASAREASHDTSGTPEYMAPEQALGEPPTPATDIYALGVVLAELVLGRRMFSGPTTPMLLAKHELACVDVGATDPPELAAVIARATARDPADRTASASELADALDRLNRTRARSGSAVVRDLEQPRAMHEVPTVLVVPPAASAAEALPIALGVHEALLVRLAALRGIRVVPRATATAEPAECVVEIAATDVMTITISRPNGAPHVLRSPIAISEVDGVAAAAASVITAAVSGERHDEREHGAMELLLQSRAVLQRDGTQVHVARELLERASRIDPDNARVLAALAMIEVRNTFFIDVTPAQLEHVRVQVATALARGPDIAEAHLAAGHLEIGFGEPAIAARHFRTAIARAPHLADAHDLLGRMLVEAGFLDEGYARLEDAFAIAPVLSSARWDIARAFALLGRWDDADRLAGELVATGVDRILSRLRFAWWRRDPSMNAEARAVWNRGGRLFLPRIMFAVFDALDDPTRATWYARRTEILERVMPMTSHRRFAFAAQLVAEVAAQCDDFDTAMSLVEYAVGANLYDLLWIDRCPLLDPLRARKPFRELRARVKHRAEAILDALYGDSAGNVAPDAAPTAIL
jgi:serine/threonine-protein kinase